MTLDNDGFTAEESIMLEYAVTYAYRMELQLSKKGTTASKEHHAIEAEKWAFLLTHVRRIDVVR